MKQILSTLTLLAFAILADAQIRLPHFFADGMVVQRDAKIPVWGWASPNESITVTFNGKSAKAKADANGVWKTYLPAMKANAKPSVLSINNGEVKISNILIGDVFLCSGQSNMELPIRRCMDVVANEVKDYSNDLIRYIKLPHQYNYVSPNSDCNVLPWQNITPQNCAEVSGICYFMARELQKVEQVPIGIINSAVGGTRVEAWTPQEVLKQFPAYTKEFENIKYHQTNWPDSIRQVEDKAGNEWENRMMATDKVVNEWRKKGYDFDAWQTVSQFGDWFKGNGSYWFRQTVKISHEDAGKAGIIRIGAMKDADSVFINGKFIGNTTYQYPPRIYKIPAGLLFQGNNEIMIHLMSQNGKADFTQGKLYQIELDKIIPLSENWQFCQGSSMQPKPGSTYFVDCPSGLYNAMIAPFQDFPIKAMLWYQGESNLSNTADYAKYLQAMVESWRNQFGADFPVVIMQLAGYMQHHEEPLQHSTWCEIREQQRIAANNIPNAALATIIDTGEGNDIHPQDKKTAGERAALQMRRLAYGETYTIEPNKFIQAKPITKPIVATGPAPVSTKVDAEGTLTVTFDSELDIDVKKIAKSLTVAGEDHKFYFPPRARAIGKDLIVYLPEEVTSPCSIRYAYDDYPIPAIFNKQGLPSAAFILSIQ